MGKQLGSLGGPCLLAAGAESGDSWARVCSLELTLEPSLCLLLCALGLCLAMHVTRACKPWFLSCHRCILEQPIPAGR